MCIQSTIHRPSFILVVVVAKLCLTLVTPWTVACQTPLSMEFPRQEYWSGLPFPSPGDFLDLGIEPPSPALRADSLPVSQQGSSPAFILVCFGDVGHLSSLPVKSGSEPPDVAGKSVSGERAGPCVAHSGFLADSPRIHWGWQVLVSCFVISVAHMPLLCWAVSCAMGNCKAKEQLKMG